MPATEKSKIASAVSSALFKEALLEELDDDGESGSWSESEDNSKSGDDEWGQSDAEGDEASELADLYTGLTQTRYTEPRGKQNRSTTHRYNLFEQTPKEFRQSVRVDAAKFDYLLSLIVDDPTFYNNSKNRQTDIAIQLAVTLEWCGTFENGNTCGRIARTYGLGTGTVSEFVDRVRKSLLRYYSRFVAWPSETKRVTSLAFHRERYGLSGCVGRNLRELFP
ncbi:hypothetical protein PF006_g19469 [Phytophthora fragariae]|uniref:DDE Tnp4 domain-containing protein n=1 Tax=Phytophthora fragariae TaxID=53985 RepID=A0A6A3SDG8_9STRA|nr:hypothetical protein PF006_g19469 [Phytophthora fragariae]